MSRSKQQSKHEPKGGRYKNQHHRSSNDNSESSKGPVVVDADNASARSSSKPNDLHQFRNINEQLGAMGLALRKVVGDGNCLFRALCDQMEGSSRNHLRLRTTLVEYMRSHRADFEPFFDPELEDEDGNTQPNFDAYLNRLAKAGTYGGNDMLVAMARLHNLCIVVHQYLEKPWQIEPPDDMLAAAAAAPVRRQIHLFYHTNGDHYDSVRMRGDMANAPTQIMIQVKREQNQNQNQNELRTGKQRKKGKKPPAASSCSYNANSSGEAVSPEEEEAIAAAVAASTAVPAFEEAAESASIEELVEQVASAAGVPPEATARRQQIERLLYEFELNADYVLNYLLETDTDADAEATAALEPERSDRRRQSAAEAEASGSRTAPSSSKGLTATSSAVAEPEASTITIPKSAQLRVAQPACLSFGAERTPPRLTDADTCLTPDNVSTASYVVAASEESFSRSVSSTTCSPPTPSDPAVSPAPAPAPAPALVDGAAAAAGTATDAPDAAAQCEAEAGDSNGSDEEEKSDRERVACASATAPNAIAIAIATATATASAALEELKKKKREKAQRPSASQVRRCKKADKKARAAQRRFEQNIATQTAAAPAQPAPDPFDENLQILIRTTELVRV